MGGPAASASRGRRSRLSAVFLVALTLLLAGLGGLAPASASPGAEPTRILIVGDSVAQGSAGDWTWRYWLWRHLERSATEVDLVGPRTDLYDQVASVHGEALERLGR